MSASIKVNKAIKVQVPGSNQFLPDLSVRILETEEETFNMKVIVREWVDIRPELEFRGFFNNKQFNALTQVRNGLIVLLN